MAGETSDQAGTRAGEGTGTPAIDAPRPGLRPHSLAERLHNGGHLAIQAARADIVEELMSGDCTVAIASSLKGALTGLRDYEKSNAEKLLTDELPAMAARLDSLEGALTGVQGFAQRESGAITPPEPTGTPTH